MNSLKERVFVVTIIAGLGSLMNSQHSTVRAASRPVQGFLGATGAVAATQTGAWNVGITGTPNVHVTNPATAPVLSLNVNDLGRIAYQSSESSPSD